MAERQLSYLLDDRETTVLLTSVAGSRQVVIELVPLTREGNAPGFRLQVMASLGTMDAIKAMLIDRVAIAFHRDGVPDRQAMQVPFELSPFRVILCLTPNDVRNLAGHIGAIVAYADSLRLVRQEGLSA